MSIAIPPAQQPEHIASDGVRRISATDRVLNYILAEMAAGRLFPGGRVNAAKIAAALEFSAAPVREALSVLAGRGILELLPDRGAVMRPFTPRDVIHIWGVLTAISALGLELAAKAVALGADTTELERRHIAIGHRPMEITAQAFYMKLNDWHYAANEMGGNPFVTEAMTRMSVSYWDHYLAQLIDAHAHIDGYLANYRRMHEAVMAGDARSAAATMHYHADWSVALIEHAAAALPSSRTRRREKPNP